MEEDSLAKDLSVAQRVIAEALAGFRVQIYLFGSAASGEAGRASDIDVGILPLEPLPTGTLSALRESLEEKYILRPIDLIDLSQVEPAFREKVSREGVAWRT